MNPKRIIILLVFFCSLSSCKKISEFNQNPELPPLEQGFKTSATIAYCTSIAASVFQGEPVPDNVTFESSTKDGYTSSGLIHIKIDATTPLPFNSTTGEILVAGLWDGTGGVISIIFGDFNIFTSDLKFYGLYTLPIIKNQDGTLTTIFAEQDILIGSGSDTLLNLSLSKPKFDSELNRLDGNRPSDIFTAVKQNIWFIDIDQKTTLTDAYDDAVEINGGGQIVQVSSHSGGILYHAMIETKYSFGSCSKNPTSGTAFIQNFKAGGFSVDLGNITLDFHSACTGQAEVILATGKYLSSNGKNINLNWN